MKQSLTHANHFAMLLMALAMAFAFLACEEKKKPGAEQAEAEAEAPPAEEASEAEGTPHEIQYGEPLTYKGQTYKTVKIGEQTWMAENLNYKTGSSWCYLNDDSNCKKYGRLYYWNAAMNACPSGWHLPSREEWNVLIETAGGKTAGKRLKSKTNWNENGNGTDDFGFSAMPSGNRNEDVVEEIFNSVGNFGIWWSSSKHVDKFGTDFAYYKSMNYASDNVSDSYIGESIGYSVRCIKGEAAADLTVLPNGNEGAKATEENCPDKKIGEPITAEAVFLKVWYDEDIPISTAVFRLNNGEELQLSLAGEITFERDGTLWFKGKVIMETEKSEGDKVSITYQMKQVYYQTENGPEDDPSSHCDQRLSLESLKVLPK